MQTNKNFHVPPDIENGIVSCSHSNMSSIKEDFLFNMSAATAETFRRQIIT
jgi:hypothetical protein